MLLFTLFTKNTLGRYSDHSRFGGWAIWVIMCLFYSLFLFINGVILFCIFSFMLKTDLKIDNLPIIICAQVFAWMGGFITPGAPGGLGVREALLTMILSDILPATLSLQVCLFSGLSPYLVKFWHFVLRFYFLKALLKEVSKTHGFDKMKQDYSVQFQVSKRYCFCILCH